MRVPKMFRFRTDNPSVVIAALVAGMIFAVAGSVLATTIGSSISVSTTLSVTGASTLTGNVGIATSTSGSALGIQGSANFAAGTSTVYSDIIFPSFIATSTNPSGIGTSTPGTLFSIQGVGSFSQTTGTSTLYSRLTFPIFMATSTSATSTLSTGGFAVGATQFVVQQNSGWVGIGTSTPGSFLSVHGVASFAQDATSTVYSKLTFPIFAATSTTATSTLSTGGFTIGADQFVVQQNSGRIGVGTTTPGSLFSIQGVANFTTDATSTLYSRLSLPIFMATSTTATSTLSTGGFAVGATQFVVQQNSGWVGIGTSTPGSLVGIQGVANFVQDATSTVYSRLSLPSFSATSTVATTTISTGGFQVGQAGALAAFTVGQSATTSVGVGTSTVRSHQFGVGGNALIGAGANGTTTLTISSSGTNVGSCIELRAADGEMVRIYATTSVLTGAYTNAGLAMPGRGLVVEAGGCR